MGGAAVVPTEIMVMAAVVPAETMVRATAVPAEAVIGAAVISAETMVGVVDAVVALAEVVAGDKAGHCNTESPPAWLPNNVGRAVWRAL